MTCLQRTLCQRSAPPMWCLQAKVRDAEKAAEWARCEREDEGAAAARDRRDLAARHVEAEAALSRLKVCVRECCMAFIGHVMDLRV